MKQITKHDVNKLTVAEIKELLPFEVLSDGEVVLIAVAKQDVNKVIAKPKAGCDVNKAKHDVTQADKADFKKSLCRHGLIYCSICKI